MNDGSSPNPLLGQAGRRALGLLVVALLASCGGKEQAPRGTARRSQQPETSRSREQPALAEVGAEVGAEAATDPPSAVALDRQTGQAGRLRQIGMVTGAVYDETSKQLHLVGDGRFPDASPTPQQIAVALRWAFADEPGGFFVSIDPLPQNPKGPWMKVRIHEAAQDTDLGWVLFESDRRLKSYSLGADTVTRIPVRSSVPGFRNSLDIAAAASGGRPNREVWSRFWLYPKETRWETEGHSMRIHTATVGVRTETMRWEAGALVSAPDLDDPDAERFAAFMTEHYDELADEEPVFRQLEQVLRLLLISEWVRKEDIPLSLAWLEEQAERPYRLPRITPSLRVGRRSTETVGRTLRTTTTRLFGGVDFEEIRPIDVPARADLETWSHAARAGGRQNARPTFGFAWNGEEFRGRTVPGPGAGQSATATFPLVEATLPGGGTFRLPGRAAAHRGPGASRPTDAAPVPALPRLYGVNPYGRDGQERQVGIDGRPDSVVPVRNYELYGADGSLIGRFEDHEIEQAPARLVVLPVRSDNLWRLYPQGDGAGVVWARHPEGHALAFDIRSAKLIGEQRDGLLIRYHYNGSGALDRITADRAAGPGEPVDTVELVQFEHGGDGGRLVAARTSDGRRVALGRGTGGGARDAAVVAYAEGGESTELTVDPDTGGWRPEQEIGGLDYVSRHGEEIARSLSSPESLPRLIPDGAFTLLVTRSSVRPLPVAAHRSRQLEAAVRSALPEDAAMLTFIGTADGRTAVLRRGHEQEEHRLEILGRNLPTERITGPEALREVARIERELVRRASDSRVEFLAVAQDGDQVTLQLGDRREQFDAGAIEWLRRNPRSDETSPLDELFLPPDAPPDGRDARDLVVYRGGGSRRPPGQDRGSGGGDGVDPVRLAAVLRERYGETRRVYLDDETRTARYNLDRLVPLRGPQDLVALVPAEGFDIQDHHLLRNLRGRLEDSGVRVLQDLATAGEAPHVLLISGHNDEELRQYLQHLGDGGFLEGRILLLNTCYADGHADLFHDLIARYGPRAILHHGDRIHFPAVQAVTLEMVEILNELGPAGEEIHPADLLGRATDRVLRDKELSEELEQAVRRLQKAVFQISRLPAAWPWNRPGLELHELDFDGEERRA